MNYDMVHSEAAHKYFFNAFYRQTNKKKHKLQILNYNICHTNIIVRQDAIFCIFKVLIGSAKKKTYC